MKPSLNRRRALWALGSLASAPLMAATPSPALPGDSVYQLQAALVDQDGRPIELSRWRGNVVLASMFYSSCEAVCPMLFETIHLTLKALPAAEREATRVLMVSFDPARDSVPVLKQTAQARGCDARWALARCDEGTARNVAAVFGIQYRRLDSGEFNHSSTIELLDRQGRIVARSGKLGTVDPALVKAIRQAVASA
jgi:protein SCO1/2